MDPLSVIADIAAFSTAAGNVFRVEGLGPETAVGAEEVAHCEVDVIEA
jgi:hypothetical protein